MAHTVIDYLMECGNLSFEEKEFCEVDSLILAQLSYLKFGSTVPKLGEDAAPISIRELYAHPAYETLFDDSRYEANNRKLYEGLAASGRFGNARLGYFVDVIEEISQTQFSAVTVFLENGPVYLAFRGTDETIVGWKEDFNLAYSKPVPGQIMSADYVNRIGGILEGDFIIGGHSKGGNLAIYSAMFCSQMIRPRITMIYNHDGPGFRPEILEQGCYDEIRSRIRKTIPQSSLVGMIMEMSEDYEVVHSHSISGVFQHDPFSWEVENGLFKREIELEHKAMIKNQGINEWLMMLNEDQLHTLSEVVFDVIAATGSDNLIDIFNDWKGSLSKMTAAVRELDPETGQLVLTIFRLLFERVTEYAKEEVDETVTQIRGEVEEALKKLEGSLVEALKKSKSIIDGSKKNGNAKRIDTDQK